VIAIVLLVTGTAVSIHALDNWARYERAMRLGDDLPPSRFPAILALTVAFGAVAVGIAVVAGVFG
jgi:putative membrane protein